MKIWGSKSRLLDWKIYGCKQLVDDVLFFGLCLLWCSNSISLMNASLPSIVFSHSSRRNPINSIVVP